MSKPCSQCGRCCLMLGAEITATQEDVARWVKEGRQDILRYADIYENLARLRLRPTSGIEHRTRLPVRQPRISMS